MKNSSRHPPQQERQEFFLGGNKSDPLNLKSLQDDDSNRISDEPTSPVRTVASEHEIEQLTPVNMRDPLNLRPASKKQRSHANRNKSLLEDRSATPDKCEPLTIQINSTSDPNSHDVLASAVSALPETGKCKGHKRHRTPDVNSPPASPKQRNLKSEQVTAKGAQKRQFVHGNYNRYYGYRNPEREEDERLVHFRREWFFGKDVLDVGCNVGHVTMTLARDFQPRRIVGMDIDGHLIDTARKSIRSFVSKSSEKSLAAGNASYPMSMSISNGPLHVQKIQADALASGKGGVFPDNLFFIQGNYVPDSDEMVDLQREEFDVILALSVTKWVHLNSGDVGLKRMFRRVYKQLRPDGIFIVEPQPLSSYGRRKNLSETIRRNYDSMEFKPNQFTAYLLSSDVGFSYHYTLAMPFNKAKGFRRPIEVFVKAGEDSDLDLASIHRTVTPLLGAAV